MLADDDFDSTGEFRDCLCWTSCAPCWREINLRGAAVGPVVRDDDAWLWPSVEGGVEAFDVL